MKCFTFDGDLNNYKNQKVKLRRENGWIECVSEQDTSTPGIIVRDISLKQSNSIQKVEKFRCRVVGWSSVPRCYIHIADATTGCKLFTRYVYLPRYATQPATGDNVESSIDFSLETDIHGKINVGVLIGGMAGAPVVGDRFYIKSINIENIKSVDDEKQIQQSQQSQQSQQHLTVRNVEKRHPMETIAHKRAGIQPFADTKRNDVIGPFYLKIPQESEMYSHGKNISLYLDGNGFVRWCFSKIENSS